MLARSPRVADRPGGAVFTLTPVIPQATFNLLRFFRHEDVLAPAFLQVLFRSGLVAPLQRKTPGGGLMERPPLLLSGSR